MMRIVEACDGSMIFANENELFSMEFYLITVIVKCGIKLLIYSQTLTVNPLKFENG